MNRDSANDSGDIDISLLSENFEIQYSLPPLEF